jgi:PAS domain S-box-containing protein
MKDEHTAPILTVSALQSLRGQVLDLQRSLEREPEQVPAAYDSAGPNLAGLLDGVVGAIAAAGETLVREGRQRRQAEEALRECENRYQHLLDSVTDYIYTVRVEDGRPVATVHGPNCVAVTGYTWQEYEAAPLLWAQMVHEKDRQAVIERANRLLAGETAPPLEHRIIHKDGSVRWVRNASVLRKDEQGRLVAYDGLITDITTRKQLEERLDAVYQLGRELTLLRDEAAIIERALETASSGLQIEGVGYGLVDEASGELESHYNLFDPPPRAVTGSYQAPRPGDLRYPHNLPSGQSVEFYLPLAGCQVCHICMSVIRTEKTRPD